MLDEALLKTCSKPGSALVVRRGGICIRARLPVENNPKLKSSPRYVNLRLEAEPKNVAKAAELAMKMHIQLKTNSYEPGDWTKEALSPAPVDYTPDYTEECLDELTFSRLRRLVEAMYDDKYPDLPKRWNTTWGKKYAPVIKLLSQGKGKVTQERLFQMIKLIPSKSSRKTTASVISTTIKEMGVTGLDAMQIREAGSGYSPKAVKPRDLPTDEQIEAAYGSIRVPEWRFMYALIWLCGIRPHEIAGAKFATIAGKKVLLVPDDTKTGFRKAPPCPYSKFVELGLEHERNHYWPKQDKFSVGKTFADYLKRFTKVDFSPYNLRHAFAARMMVRGISIDRAARFMGHTKEVHEKIYRAWVNDESDNRIIEEMAAELD